MTRSFALKNAAMAAAALGLLAAAGSADASFRIDPIDPPLANAHDHFPGTSINERGDGGGDNPNWYIHTDVPDLPPDDAGDDPNDPQPTVGLGSGDDGQGMGGFNIAPSVGDWLGGGDPGFDSGADLQPPYLDIDRFTLDVAPGDASGVNGSPGFGMPGFDQPGAPGVPSVIPTPSSIGLLGLTAAALLRRRRR